MSLCAACGPTYQSVRAYIPHHEKPHQVQVDANLPLRFKADHYATQVDVSYSVDESLLVAVGGHSMKGYSCGTDCVRDEYHGVHFAAGTYHPFPDVTGITGRGHFLAGVGLQNWHIDKYGDAYEDMKDKVADAGALVRFNTKVVNPFVQGGFTMTPHPASVSVIARLDVPVFLFRERLPEDINPNRTRGLLSSIFDARVSLTTNIAVYAQAILRLNVPVDTAFQVSNFNTFIGLSYVFGGAD